MTKEYNVHRLRWLLKDVGPKAEAQNVATFLTTLADAGTGSTRADLVLLAAALAGDSDAVKKLPARLAPFAANAQKLAPASRAIVHDAGADLGHLLSEVPDETLAADWHSLTTEMRDDLLVPPATVLANMERVRKQLLVSGNARMFMIGSHATQAYLAAPVSDLIGALAHDRRHVIVASSQGMITNRLAERTPDARPVFVGLVNPNTQSGVIINSAPAPGYRDTTRSQLLEFLAGKLYAGHGAHGMFMKTWAAGLAYSNGLGSSPGSARIRYYAERCPELPQTMRFVINELKKAQLDTNLAEYAIALAFEEFRSASSYELRGEAMAADLADDVTPDVVRAFRRAILALRNTPHLAEDLFKKMPEVYGRVLPGYNIKAADVQGGINFVIGPEKQLGLWEEYLRSVEGSGTTLYRLYPRDFWLTGSPVY